MTKSIAFPVLLLAMMALACAHPNSYQREDERVSLQFVPRVPAENTFLELDFANEEAQKIKAICEAEVTVFDYTNVPAVRAEAAGFAAGGIAAVVGFGIDLAAKALEKEKGKYSASFTGRASTDFFEKLDDDRIIMRHPCIYLKRTAKVDDKTTVTSDLIARFSVSESGDAFRIEPLRSRQAYSKAKVGKKGKLAVNVALAIDAVWQIKGKVNATRIGDVNLVAANVKLPKKGKATTVTYGSAEWFESQWFPVPPRSQDASGHQYGLGSLTLTATVQQDGKSIGKDILGETSSLLDSKKDDITDQVKDAIEKALE